MACHNPIQGWRPRRGRQLVFNKNEGWVDQEVTVPCGRCIGCKLDRSLMWAVRITNELTLHEKACFLTLTYKDVPDGGTLLKDDLQNFFKRLRFYLDDNELGKIRYYACGEYGSETNRPHYHVCLFGWNPDDKKPYKTTPDGHQLWTSKQLEEIWGHGFAVIGNLTFETAAYTARYVTKKITGDKSPEHYNGRLPEFSLSSRRPGIGANWAKKFALEIKGHASIYARGQTFPVPAYYKKILNEKFVRKNYERRKIKESAIKQTNPYVLDSIQKSKLKIKSKIKKDV